MPFDFRRIVEIQKKALVLIDNPEKRESLEQFLESTGPLVESAARESLYEIVEEINTQLAPHTRIRLLQEGQMIMPDVVSLLENMSRGRAMSASSEVASKVLVRMPSEVKTRATEAAQKAGTSLNNWTVTVLERALSNLRDRQSSPANGGENLKEGDNSDTSQDPEKKPED